MEKNSTLYKIINLFWVPIAWIPFFGGMGIIYAGIRVKHTRWIDEGILYMIPFIMLTFVVFGSTIPTYLGIFVCLITIIRSVMMIKPFLNKLEQINNENNTQRYSEENQIPQNQYQQKIQDIQEISFNNHKSQTDLNNTVKQTKINQASLDELLELPEISQQIAEKIIHLRQKGIYINSPNDLSIKLGLNTIQIQKLESQMDFSRNNTENHTRILDI